MESQYHQFGSSDSSSVHPEHRMTPQTGKTFDFDSVISGVIFNSHRLSVGVDRSEEDRGLCPLWSPAAAAADPADGHWDQM